MDIIVFLLRISSGLMLCVFAFAPAWIAFNIVMSVIAEPRALDWIVAVVFAACVLITYFLLLLAYRAFTGRGRKGDGGLLPPWAMKAVAGLVGIAGLASMVFLLFQNEPLRAILSMVVCFMLALSVYRQVHEREVGTGRKN